MRVFGMITTEASSSYTDHALRSFFTNTELRALDRFYLIDNDCCYSVPQQLTEQITVIKPDSPRSFAANVNEVMTKAFGARADLFFLNNDLIFPEGWLPPLLAPEHALLSPLSNREIQHVTDGFTWKNVLTLEEYLPREKDLHQIAAHHIKHIRGQEQVLSLPFFCIKIPYTVYSEVGPFDERFGKGGGEDYDYCLRAALAGIPAKYVAQSYVLHFNGKSTWAGAEDTSASALRREQYAGEFARKWGEPLKEILIDEHKERLNDFPEAKSLFTTGKTAEAIRILQGSSHVS